MLCKVSYILRSRIRFSFFSYDYRVLFNSKYVHILKNADKMVSYVISGSHVTFYEAMTKINKILPEVFGSLTKLTKGHVTMWLARSDQNGGSKHGPIVCDLKILRFGRASRNDPQKNSEILCSIFDLLVFFYLLDTVFCEPWLCTSKLRLVSTVFSLGKNESVLCTRTWSVTKFMTYDSGGFKYWYKKKCWTFSHQNLF